MSVDRDPIEELLASICDGRPPDWDAAGHSPDPATRARLDSLRVVSRIADFNRGQQHAAEGSTVPERWGELLLLERLGAGAHAEVYRAWDPGLQREVALKRIRPEAESATLLGEGRAAARIRHPHVVTIHGIDRRDGRVGMWMELVRGPTLDQRVRSQGPLDAVEVRRIGLEIGSAIAAVHAAGLLHRDVKPANMVRDAEGRNVLTDFGLGLRQDDMAPRVVGPAGTPMYMAPELLAGAPATVQSDVYSLGLALWFALAGRHPFEATTLADLLAAAGRGPRPALSEIRPELPAPLVAIMERAIAPDPRTRFASAQQLVEALEAWRPGAAAPAHRRGWALAAGVVLPLLLAAAVFGLWRGRNPAAPAPATVTPEATLQRGTYTVEASLLRRGESGTTRLVDGDRVKPGDRLSLEVRTSRAAWIYVLNEDERGEHYLLFPQPRFDARNPLAADRTFVLPGTVGGRENAWTVTSAGGRESFLIIVSPAPVSEIEADLERLPAPRPDRPIEYARIGSAAIERLRGVGGVAELPAEASHPAPRTRVFDRFRSLAGRDTGVSGMWVRQIVLENPR